MIADPQVRYLGTIGGNVANGDPGNDMPAVMMCLGAIYHLVGKGGGRQRRRPRLLSGRLFHCARARRDPFRNPYPRSTGGPRLRLREAEAQGRRLRDRGGGDRADNGGRPGDERLHRPDQCRRDAALGGRRGADPRRIDASTQRLSGARSPRPRRSPRRPSDTRGPAAYRTKMAGVMLTRALERARSRARLIRRTRCQKRMCR